MDHITCYNCSSEFTVESIYEDDSPVCFCPFCGLELEESDEEDDSELDDEDLRY